MAAWTQLCSSGRKYNVAGRKAFERVVSFLYGKIGYEVSSQNLTIDVHMRCSGVANSLHANLYIDYNHAHAYAIQI